MSELSPKVAAELARGVYQVQEERFMKAFLKRSEFQQLSEEEQNKGKTNPAVKTLKAEIGSRLINTRDGFGVCALGGASYKQDVFLIFRGSTSANNNADWVSNGRIGLEFSRTGMPVHIGFNSIFCSMLSEIKNFLKANSERVGTVHCIGHSLGGAIATLASDWAKSNLRNPVKLYTFGAPRPAMSLFAMNLRRKLGRDAIHRVYHATDPVPMIPLFPFVHPPLPGYGHYISSSENILSADAHDMKKYVDSVDGMNWKNLERRPPAYSVESAIGQWLESKIHPDDNSSKVWQWINSGLIYVLKKVAGAALMTLQAGVTGAITLADKLAWLLRSGIDLAKSAGTLVKNLMRKIMRALGMKVVEKVEDLTHSLIRNVLMRLMERTAEAARRAIRRTLR